MAKNTYNTPWIIPGPELKPLGMTYNPGVGLVPMAPPAPSPGNPAMVMQDPMDYSGGGIAARAGSKAAQPMLDGSTFKQAILMIKAALDPEGFKAMIGSAGNQVGNAAEKLDLSALFPPGSPPESMAPEWAKTGIGMDTKMPNLGSTWGKIQDTSGVVSPAFFLTGQDPLVRLQEIWGGNSDGVSSMAGMTPDVPVGQNPETQMEAVAALLGLPPGEEVKPPLASPAVKASPEVKPPVQAPAPKAAQPSGGTSNPPAPSGLRFPGAAPVMPFLNSSGPTMVDTLYGGQAPVQVENLYGDLAPAQGQAPSKLSQVAKALSGVKAPEAAGPSKQVTSSYIPGSTNFSFADQLLTQILGGNTGALPKLPFL